MDKRTEVYKLLTMYKNEIHGKRFSEQSELTSDYADEIVKLFTIPAVMRSKINNYKDALEYIVKNESGTMGQMRKDINEDIIRGMQLTGRIKT